jgi:hypothetical protein
VKVLEVLIHPPLRRHPFPTRPMFMSLTVCENRLESSRLSRTSLMRLIISNSVNVASRVLYSEVSYPMIMVIESRLEGRGE